MLAKLPSTILIHGAQKRLFADAAKFFRGGIGRRFDKGDGREDDDFFHDQFLPGAQEPFSGHRGMVVLDFVAL